MHPGPFVGHNVQSRLFEVNVHMNHITRCTGCPCPRPCGPCNDDELLEQHGRAPAPAGGLGKRSSVSSRTATGHSMGQCKRRHRTYGQGCIRRMRESNTAFAARPWSRVSHLEGSREGGKGSWPHGTTRGRDRQGHPLGLPSCHHAGFCQAKRPKRRLRDQLRPQRRCRQVKELLGQSKGPGVKDPDARIRKRGCTCSVIFTAGGGVDAAGRAQARGPTSPLWPARPTLPQRVQPWAQDPGATGEHERAVH